MAEGHLDMVAMTRAHIADPHLVKKLIEGRADDIRQCVGAGYCIDRIYVGGDALCLQNAATGREATMPHVIPKADRSLKVVVVGGGPAGLEAARVCAERGHRVVLFEKERELGGQINIASKGTWREALSGIPRWLGAQVRKLGVDVRLGVEATEAAVQAETPDVVIVATGGRPNLDEVVGAAHVVPTWDVLTGKVEAAGSVLLYDATGQHHGASTAEFLAKKGCLVEIATQDRMVGEEIGTTNQPVHLRELYKLGVVMTPNTELAEVYPEGNRLVAVLRNTMTLAEEERLVDRVVTEYGTLPVDAVFRALRAGSVNDGVTDQHALVEGRPQPWAARVGANGVNGAGASNGAGAGAASNGAVAVASANGAGTTGATNCAATAEAHPGGYALYRVGDCVAGRNIHAALYDSLRLCKDL